MGLSVLQDCLFQPLSLPLLFNNTILFKAAGIASCIIQSCITLDLFQFLFYLFHWLIITFNQIEHPLPPPPPPATRCFDLSLINLAYHSVYHTSVWSTRSSVPRPGLVLCVHPPHLGDTWPSDKSVHMCIILLKKLIYIFLDVHDF